MAILVTGATGDVGKEVVAELIGNDKKSGEEVAAMDIALNTRRLPASERVKPIRGNVTNLSEVLSAIRSTSAGTVIHLASLLTTDSESRPYEAVGVNMYGTATVLEASRLAGVKRVVFASTSSVYGTPERSSVIDESFPREPMNIYGSLKYSAELYAQAFTRKYGLSYAACRLRIIFGPGQRPDTGAMKILDIKRLLQELREKREGIFVGEPDQRLDVTHMKDAAHALVLAAQAPKLEHNSYNVMTGSYSFREIASAFEKAVPGARVKFDPTGSKKPASAGPGTNFGVYDTSRAKRELGYEPAFTIDTIVKQVVDWEAANAPAR